MEEKGKNLPLIGGRVLIEPSEDLVRTEKLFGTMQNCGMKVCTFCIDGILYASDEDKQLIDRYIEATEIACNNALSAYLSFEIIPGLSERALGKLDSIVTRFSDIRNVNGWIVSISDENSGREKYTELLHNVSVIIRKSASLHEILLDCKDIPDSVWKYDFEALKNDFTGFGLSFVPVRNVPVLSRRRYNFAFSASCDIIRSATYGKPFWITALQSGNNGVEGEVSPSRAEITQWMWTALGRGASGILFDTLNLPASGMKAGGEALFDLLGEFSRKSLSVKEIISSLDENKELFLSAGQVESPIYVLYSDKSLSLHAEEAVKPCQAMQSAMSAYEILMENGIRPGFCEMSEYDWTSEDYRGKCIIISGQEAVSSEYNDKISDFVKKGGKLIIEGRSFYFDENMRVNAVKPDFPLADVFGGRPKEFDAIRGYRKIKLTDKRFWAHRWYGLIKNDASGETLPLLRNKYGRGKVLWIPSMIILGAVNSGHRSRLSKLLMKEVAEAADTMPLRFRRRRSGITLQLLETDKGYITIVSNKGRHRRKVRFRTAYKVDRLLYSDIRYERRAKAKNRKIKLRSQQTAAVLWKTQ